MQGEERSKSMWRRIKDFFNGIRGILALVWLLIILVWMQMNGKGKEAEEILNQ